MVQEPLKGTPPSSGETTGSASAPLRRQVVVAEGRGHGEVGPGFQCWPMAVASVPELIPDTTGH